SLQDVLPESICSLAKNHMDIYEATSFIETEWSSKMRLIPAKSLGVNQHLLCAFKPDYVGIHDAQGSPIQKNALIVFTDQILSNDESFQCIIHPLLSVDKEIHSAS